MKNKTWTISLNGTTVVYEQDFGVENGSVAQQGTTMARPLDVFLAGVERMKAAGAVVVEGSR